VYKWLDINYDSFFQSILALSESLQQTFAELYQNCSLQ